MTTQTDERVDSIEHLDHRPECSADCHGPVRPKADYWINFHGCEELFSCTECLTYQRSWFYQPPVGAECGICGQFFTTFEAAHTKVVPL